MVHLIGPYFIAQFTAALKSTSRTSLKHSSAFTRSVQIFFLFSTRETHRERWCYSGGREMINLKECTMESAIEKRVVAAAAGTSSPAVSGFMNSHPYREIHLAHTHPEAKNFYDLMYVMRWRVIYDVLRYSHPLFYFLKMECLHCSTYKAEHTCRWGILSVQMGKGCVKLCSIKYLFAKFCWKH